jgi:ABC-type uncharacterized transport system permease subunit
MAYSEVGDLFIFVESSLSSGVDVGTSNAVYSVCLNGICLSAPVYFVFFFFFCSSFETARAPMIRCCAVHSYSFSGNLHPLSFCCPIQ